MVQFLEEARALCTSPQSACEKSWALGTAGQCNVATGECVCPDGFSGRDDWAAFNDCRINEDFRRGFWIIALVINCIAFSSSIYAFAFFVHRFGIQKPDVVGSGTRISGRSAGTGSDRTIRGTNSSSGSKENENFTPKLEDGWASEQKKIKDLTRKYKTRQRWTLQSIGFSIFSGIGVFIYSGGILGGLYRFDRPFILDLGLLFAFLGFVFQVWSSVLVYFQALPNLRIYGKLFGVDSILIRKPYLIRQATHARLVIFTLVGFILFIALRHFTSFDLDQLDLVDSLCIVFVALMVLDYTVFSSILSILLRRLYQRLKDLSIEAAQSGAIAGGSEKKFDRARHTVNGLFYLLVATGPVGIVLMFLSAFVPSIRTRMHVIIALLFIFANLGSFGNNMVLVFRFTRRFKQNKGEVQDDGENK